MWDLVLTGFAGGAIGWVQYAVGAAIGIAGLIQGSKAAKDAKRNLAARLARRKAQLKVALAENEKVYGELGVAQRKHTSQRIRGLADASRGTLTANTMYGGGRGLFAEQASGMRLAAKEKAKAILAIRAAYESDVDTSAVDAAKMGQANALLGLAGTVAGMGTEDAPPDTEDPGGGGKPGVGESAGPPPARGTNPAAKSAQERAYIQARRDAGSKRLADQSRKRQGEEMARIQDSADPLTVTSKPIVAGSLAASNAPKAKPGTSTAQKAVETAGFEDTEEPASKKKRQKKRKMTSAAASRKSKTTSMRKARTKTKAKPMKGATKTENGVKYTYDGTNWVKNPTL